MADPTKTIDCSICKLTFDEDHGVWVCLECTEKLTNAIHQASMSPQPQFHPSSHSAHSAHSSPKLHRHIMSPSAVEQTKRRSSLPKDYNISSNPDHSMLEMTLFLELTNNGNKRRFKYKPYDLHKDCTILQIKENLLKRFAHDFHLKYLLSSKQINNLSSFEINDKRHRHQFIIFEHVQDLFDGAKIKINIDKFYFQKYQIHTTKHSKLQKANSIHSISSMSRIRRRSKSASSIEDELISERDLLNKPPNIHHHHQHHHVNNNNNNKRNDHDNQRNDDDEKGGGNDNKLNLKLKIKTNEFSPKSRLKPRQKHDIVSPIYMDHNLHNNPSYDIIEHQHGGNIKRYQSESANYDFIQQTMIIDNGSGLMKCGFGGLSDNTGPHGPQIVFPTAYFNPPHQYGHNVEIGQRAIDLAEKLSLYNTSSLIRPIRRGNIYEWKEMEYIWQNILNSKLKRLFNHHNHNEIEYNLENHPILMTERYQTPYQNKEKLLQVMFESFNIPSLYVAHSACLSIYGTGRTKGIVLDIGDGITSVIAMLDRVTLSNNPGSKVVEFGGYDVTQDIMKEYNISYLHANRIKEKYYSVPYDRSDVLFADQHKAIYKLPDGKELHLGKNRMIKPLHFMFDKSSDNKFGGINVSELVVNCIKSNDVDIQNLLWRNIVLSGGTTMMDGLAERFAKEIKSLTPVKTQVIAGRSRRYLSFVGAVVMSSISTFKDISISKEMYREHGASRAVKEMTL